MNFLRGWQRRGVGIPGQTIFLSSAAIPPTGDGPYLSMKETGGTGSTRIHNKASAATHRPTAQISVRAKDYIEARAMAASAHTALDGIFNKTLTGVKYISVTARQLPTDAGSDEVGRAMVVFNIDAEKEPS
jgi:hypothetical protein